MQKALRVQIHNTQSKKLTTNCEQVTKTGCKLVKNVYDKSSSVRNLSERREESPATPMAKQEDRIKDSIRGQEADVIANESSRSCLQKQKKRKKRKCNH